jgi:hypothetical protein
MLSAIDVALAEQFACRTEDHDLVGPGQHRRLEAFHVGCQHRIAHAGVAPDAGHHLGVVAHLRHPLRTDEAGDFDFLEAGILQAVHQLDLDRGRHRLLFILQPVARTDIDEFDFGRQGHDGLG